MRITNNPDLTTENTGYPAEPCWQKEGQPTLYYRMSAVRGAIRRAAKRQHLLVDEHIGPGAPVTLTVIRKGERTCGKCGTVYKVSVIRTVPCPTCDAAKRGKGAA